MDSDDVVETSDVEELEEIHGLLPTPGIAKSLLNDSPIATTTEPPRKRIKLSHEPNEDAFTTATSSPQRPQASSTRVNSSSPIIRSSKSLTHSPRIIENPSQNWNKINTTEPQTPPSFEESEDPLLLHSPPQRFLTPDRSPLALIQPSQSPRKCFETPLKFSSSKEITSTTPNISPPGPWFRTSTNNLSSLSPPTSQTINFKEERVLLVEHRLNTSIFPLSQVSDLTYPSSQENATSTVDGNRIAYSPPKTPLLFPESSPLTPLSPNAPDRIQLNGLPARSEPRSRSASVQPEVLDEHIPEIPPEEPLQESRYALRKRNIAQIKPFTVEQMQYKHSMKAVPEAIVKFKSLVRGHHSRHIEDRYEEEGETQQGGFVYTQEEDEDATWEEKEKRTQERFEHRKRLELERRAAEARNNSSLDYSHLPEILRDSLSTDDEEREMNTLPKEARRLLRRQEKEKKAREEQARLEKILKKAKRFPISVAQSSKNYQVDSEESDDNAATYYSLGSSSHPEVANEDTIIHDYFRDEEEDFYANDRNENSFIDDPLPIPRASRRPSSHSPAPENSLEAPIEIDSDEPNEDNPEDDLHHSQSAGEFSDIDIDLPPEKLRILSKTMPKFMILALAKKESDSMKKKKKQAQDKSKRDDSEGPPLLPGQSRIRKAVHPVGIRDIKGDSESEVEGGNNPDSDVDKSGLAHALSEDSDSGSDIVDMVQTYRRPAPTVKKPVQIIELSDNDYSDEDDIIDDEDLQIILQDDDDRNHGAASRVRDENLINYMLSRSNTIGGSRKKKEPARYSEPSNRKSSSRYKFDVMTSNARGTGRNRQMLLSFDGHGNKKNYGTSNLQSSKTSTSRIHPPAGRSTGHRGGARAAIREIVVDDTKTIEERKKRSRKEKEKKRRDRAKKGVWTFTNDDRQGIENGRKRDSVFVTVNVEEEGFHRALTAPVSHKPQNYDWSRDYIPLPRVAKPRSHVVLAPLESKKETENQVTDIPSDLNILLPHSGKSFAISSTIKKGWLRELVAVISGTQDPVPPAAAAILGFELGPDMRVEDFCETIPRIFDGFLDFATGLPDPDFEELNVQWTSLTRLVSRLLSWFAKTAGEKGPILQEVVEKEIARTVAQIRELDLPFIHTPILSVSWFLLEFSIRLAPRSTFTKIIKDSSFLLMHLLLRFGMRKTMDALQQDTEFDNVSGPFFAAELWVYLIHTLTACNSGEPTGRQKVHPFWSAFMDVLKSRSDMSNWKTTLERSEDTWLTIFSLCSLSHFTVHGMTVAQSHLPSYWDIVAFALQQIRLTLSLEDEGRVSVEARDKYIGLVIFRCFHLREHWKWKLVDVSTMLGQMADIFRSRRFSNLLHEKSDFPEFFRFANWELLSIYDPKDTAYSIFLKLIVGAAREDDNIQNGKVSPKIKKLLALAVPVGSLPFSKASPPSKPDMSKFFNRLGAVAVAVYLDKSECDDRISKARNYINFAEADINSQISVIRGISNWSRLLVASGNKLTAIADWIKEISDALAGDLVKFMNLEPAAVRNFSDKSFDDTIIHRKNRLMYISLFLVASVRKIIESLAKYGLHPENGFLEPLESFLETWVAKKSGKVRNQCGLLMQAIVDARAKAIGSSLNQFAPSGIQTENESQESQDYFNFADINWNEAALPATDALDASESRLKEALQRVKFTLNRIFGPVLQPPPPNISLRQHERDCDKWVRMWLWVCTVMPANQWSKYLKLLDEQIDIIEDRTWKRRVRLSIMFQMLHLEPEMYSTYADRAIEAFILALVSETITLEREYVALLISSGGLQHPLLVNANCLPAPNLISKEFEITPEQFADLRIQLLKVVFKNVDGLIERGMAEKDKFIGFLVTMLSCMRCSRTHMNERSEKFSHYTDFCKTVYASMNGYQSLRMEPRLQWVVPIPADR